MAVSTAVVVATCCTSVLILALTASAGGAQQPSPADAVNAQLYKCNSSDPWLQRQSWTFNPEADGGSTMLVGASALQLQLPNPSLSTTCPGGGNADKPCFNLVIGPSASALRFSFETSTGQISVSTSVSGQPNVTGLCVSDSESVSRGFLTNVFLTDCAIASTNWTVASTSTPATVLIKNRNGQCLDVGSGGSVGDLGFELKLLPAPRPNVQAFNSSSYTSWGGSVIKADDGGYHMFAAVFAGHQGLGKWSSTSEIMHLVSQVPEGPFTPTKDGPNADGIIIPVFAHNPTITRANDGTYLLFSIGRSPLVASKSLNGPWFEVTSFKSTSCNNPAPLAVPGRDEIYVVCHNGPNPSHWGSSVGLVWTPSWNSSVWHNADNITQDLLDGGRTLFNHPVEDPFFWYQKSTAPSAPGSFHLLCHGFRMGMANASGAAIPGPGGPGTSKGEALGRSGNGYGVYANAESPFGPWRFQEARVVYTSVLDFGDGSHLGLIKRERPHLLLGEDGYPTHLYNGVCPNGNNESLNGTQPEHCFTAVQPVARS